MRALSFSCIFTIPAAQTMPRPGKALRLSYVNQFQVPLEMTSHLASSRFAKIIIHYWKFPVPEKILHLFHHLPVHNMDPAERIFPVKGRRFKSVWAVSIGSEVMPAPQVHFSVEYKLSCRLPITDEKQTVVRRVKLRFRKTRNISIAQYVGIMQNDRPLAKSSNPLAL